jgi:hypothetical protein
VGSAESGVASAPATIKAPAKARIVSRLCDKRTGGLERLFKGVI